MQTKQLLELSTRLCDALDDIPTEDLDQESYNALHFEIGHNAAIRSILTTETELLPATLENISGYFAATQEFINCMPKEEPGAATVITPLPNPAMKGFNAGRAARDSDI